MPTKITVEAESLEELAVLLQQLTVLLPRPRRDFSQHIDVLELSARPYNALIAEGVFTVDQLLRLSNTDLRKTPNMGAVSIAEIYSRLEDFKRGLADSKATPATPDAPQDPSAR